MKFTTDLIPDIAVAVSQIIRKAKLDDQIVNVTVDHTQGEEVEHYRISYFSGVLLQQRWTRNGQPGSIVARRGGSCVEAVVERADVEAMAAAVGDVLKVLDSE
jgi:hypothetical protein